MVKEFKSLFPYGSYLGCGNDRLSHNVAHTLFDFGVQKINPAINFIGGHEDTKHLDIWANNIECIPGIQVWYKDKYGRRTQRPLLFAIFEHLDIRFSGGAGKQFMGAGFHKSNMKGWQVQRLEPDKFILEICAYFNAIKEHHAL